MVEPTHLIQILVNLDHLPKDRGHLSKFYPSKPRSNSPTIWDQSTIKNMVDFPLITCHVNVGSWRAHHHPSPSLETSSPPVQQLRLVGPHGAVDSPTTERSQGISPRPTIACSSQPLVIPRLNQPVLVQKCPQIGSSSQVWGQKIQKASKPPPIGTGFENSFFGQKMAPPATSTHKKKASNSSMYI